MTVTFDKPLPAHVDGSSFVAENLTYSPSLTVRGNHFESIPTRGLLVTTREPVLIEDNVFDQMEMASIYVSGDANSWYESSAVRDMTIRNNVFIRPSNTGASGHPVMFFDPIANQLRDQKVHSGVSITDNIFLVGDSTILDAKSVEGLEFTGNRILRYDGGLQPELAIGSAELAPGQGTSAVLEFGSYSHPLFPLRGAADVTFAGNSYDDGLNRSVVLQSMTADAVTDNDADLTVGGSDTSPLRTVGFTSPDTSVATVDIDGTVVAHSLGTAEITAWAQTPVGVADSAPVKVLVTDTSEQPEAGPWRPSDGFTVVRPVADRAWGTDDGGLDIVTEGSSLWATGNGVRNVHVLDVPEVAVGESVTVRMTGRTSTWYEEAGFGFYGGDDDYVLVQRKHNNGARTVSVVNETGGSPAEGGPADTAAETVWLRLTRTADTTFQASHSTDGTTFAAAGPAVTNATADLSRLAFVVGNSNSEVAQRQHFVFHDLVVGETEVPLTTRDAVVVTDPLPGAYSPPRPEAPSRIAQLAAAGTRSAVHSR